MWVTRSGQVGEGAGARQTRSPVRLRACSVPRSSSAGPKCKQRSQSGGGEKNPVSALPAHVSKWQSQGAPAAPC